MEALKDTDRRRDNRKPFQTEFDLFIDDSHFVAESIDISEFGFRFRIDKPLRFRVRMDLGTEMMEREMQIVWSRKANGDMVYGLEFCDGGWQA